MNVSLTPELEQVINNKVESGMYHSASEVVREGLRLLVEQDQLRQLRFEELKREVGRSVAQAEQGDAISAEEVFSNLRERNKRAMEEK